MDWKYKHFHQERTYQSSPDLTSEAARTYFVEALGWKIADSAEGFNAEGYGFSHKCNANLKFRSEAGATRVIVDLAVSRAGGSGFMLFDVGGYYSIQIRHWLDGIQWNLHANLSPASATSSNPPLPTTNKGAARLFHGCLALIVAMFLLYVIVTFFEAVVGLITGHLHLVGRGGTITFEGTWARIISVLILMFLLYVAWRIKKKPVARGR